MKESDVIDIVQRASQKGWSKDQSKSRQYRSDSMFYETDGRHFHKVFSETLIDFVAYKDDGLLQMHLIRKEEPFHVFPKAKESLRHVVDVFRCTFNIGVDDGLLVIEVTRSVDNDDNDKISKVYLLNVDHETACSIKQSMTCVQRAGTHF
jgi:hypothetical protein